jgi:hypothetical protein
MLLLQKPQMHLRKRHSQMDQQRRGRAYLNRQTHRLSKPSRNHQHQRRSSSSQPSPLMRSSRQQSRRSCKVGRTRQ